MQPGKLHEALGLFSQMTDDQEADLRGEGIHMIGRWHNLVEGEGAMVCETESADAISAYALRWNHFMDLRISPVLEDSEVRALGAQLS